MSRGITLTKEEAYELSIMMEKVSIALQHIVSGTTLRKI